MPQKDTVGSRYFEYRPKEKEVYLLTVILTFINIILAPVLIVACVLAAVFTEIFGNNQCNKEIKFVL